MAGINKKEALLLFLGDIVSFGVALWGALFLRYFEIPDAELFFEHLTPFSILFLLWVGVFFIAGLYAKQTALAISKLPTTIIIAQLFNIVFAALFFFFIPYFGITPKVTLVLYLLVSLVCIVWWRLTLFPWLRPRRRIRAVVVGGGREVDELCEEIDKNPRYGLERVSRLDPSILSTEDIGSRLETLIRREKIRVVILDTGNPRCADALSHIFSLSLVGVHFVDAAVMYEDIFERVPVHLVSEEWFLTSASLLPRTFYDSLKRAIDVVVASLGLVVLSPFILCGALAAATTKGSLFIFQERVGRYNKTFRLVKFRTWLFDDHGDAELHKKNRITAVGKFLRKTRIDEFPQLLNVLRGELSLVGPRPEIPKLIAVYEREIPFYHLRHLIAPGLSGFAQINDYDAPREVADIPKTTKKLSYDLYYFKHRSLLLDLKIILITLRALLSRSGT